MIVVRVFENLLWGVRWSAWFITEISISMKLSDGRWWGGGGGGDYEDSNTNLVSVPRVEGKVKFWFNPDRFQTLKTLKKKKRLFFTDLLR